MKLLEGVTVYAQGHKYTGEVPEHLSGLVPEKHRAQPQKSKKDKPEPEHSSAMAPKNKDK